MGSLKDGNHGTQTSGRGMAGAETVLMLRRRIHLHMPGGDSAKP